MSLFNHLNSQCNTKMVQQTPMPSTITYNFLCNKSTSFPSFSQSPLFHFILNINTIFIIFTLPFQHHFHLYSHSPPPTPQYSKLSSILPQTKYHTLNPDEINSTLQQYQQWLVIWFRQSHSHFLLLNLWLFDLVNLLAFWSRTQMPTNPVHNLSSTLYNLGPATTQSPFFLNTFSKSACLDLKHAIVHCTCEIVLTEMMINCRFIGVCCSEVAAEF